MRQCLICVNHYDWSNTFSVSKLKLGYEQPAGDVNVYPRAYLARRRENSKGLTTVCTVFCGDGCGVVGWLLGGGGGFTFASPPILLSNLSDVHTLSQMKVGSLPSSSLHQNRC